MFFEIFSSLGWPFKGPLHLKKFQQTLILAFEANSAALSRENETKIVKITHSVPFFRSKTKKRRGAAKQIA